MAKSIPTLLIIIMCLVMKLSLQRIYSNSYNMVFLRRQRGWIFLDRMTFGKGQGKVNVKTKLQIKEPRPDKQYVIEVAIIPDRLWSKQTVLQCNTNDMTASQRQQRLTQQKVLVTRMTVDKDMQDVQWLTINIDDPQQTYHFVLRDCQKNLINEYFSRDTKINVEITMLNNGRHHGEQQSSNSFTLPILVGITLVMLRLTKGLRDSLDNEFDYPKVLLAVGLWINLAALMCKFLNHFIYIYITGKQYAAFDFIYLLMHSISQSFITCILIFVAYGWTITFIKGKDFDLYIPLLSMLGLINIILTMLGKINDNDHAKFHMYDSIPSYILIFFRIIAVIAFFIGIVLTMLNNRNDKLIMQFYKKYAVMGALYFLSLPILMLISQLLKDTERQQFVFIFVQLIKNGVNFILTYMVTSKKSEYKQVKFNNRSFMQIDGNKFK